METKNTKMSRRQMLKATGLAAAGALLAACAPQTTPTPQIVEVTKVVERVSTQVVEKIVEVTPTTKPVKVYKVTFWEHAPWTTGAVGKKGEDFVYQHILNTYGLDVTIVPAPSTDADAKLNASIAAGQMPDVIQAYWGPSNTVCNALVEQNVLSQLMIT